MKPQHKQIVQQQLDKTLSLFDSAKAIQPPVKGWIRAVRNALGMTGKQLAHRLKVSQPRIPQLEQDEVAGSVMLKTMQQVAEAMDCVFVYAMVPRTSLKDSIRVQARKVAAERMQRVSHTMLLEGQGLSAEETQASFDAAVEKLIREMPRELWEAKP
jgi:predicted DNA-binding mobile mystery protein A